jgi:hypothetical protein
MELQEGFNMVRKTDEERLQELQKKIEQIEVKKQQVEARLKEKERKERTRRLIQVGAIFEGYFNIVGEDQAEKIAYGMKNAVDNHREQLMSIDVEESKKANKIVYKIQEERLIMPEGEKAPYQTS